MPEGVNAEDFSLSEPNWHEENLVLLGFSNDGSQLRMCGGLEIVLRFLDTAAKLERRTELF